MSIGIRQEPGELPGKPGSFAAPRRGRAAKHVNNRSFGGVKWGQSAPECIGNEGDSGTAQRQIIELLHTVGAHCSCRTRRERRDAGGGTRSPLTIVSGARLGAA